MLLALRSQWESQVPRLIQVEDQRLDVVAVAEETLVADGAAGEQ